MALNAISFLVSQISVSDLSEELLIAVLFAQSSKQNKIPNFLDFI